MSSSKLVNGAKQSSAYSKNLPHSFVDGAFEQTAKLLLALHKSAAPTTRNDVVGVLVEILSTGMISARTEYDLGPNHQRGDAFLPLLQACSSDVAATAGNVGALDVIDAVLSHVRDVPERVLLSMLRFVMLNVAVDDVLAYYSKNSNGDNPGKCLVAKYHAEITASDELGDEEKLEMRETLAAKLTSRVLLDVTAKVVSYSECNGAFLSGAMREGLVHESEVETLLLTLAKLLQSGIGGGGRKGSIGHDDKNEDGTTLTAGAIQWITSLTDAHMSGILKLTSEGRGVVVDRIRKAVRLAVRQAEFASEIKEMLDFVIHENEGEGGATRGAAAASDGRGGASVLKTTKTVDVPSYSIERLSF